MDVRAHLLLQVDPGRSREAAHYLSEVPSVVDATQTSGPYDLIVTVHASTEGALHQTTALARRTPGLRILRICRPS